MSDEPPPSLRLKPRVKPEGDPAASRADAAPPPPPKAEEAGVKIRLRPKLAPEPEPEAEELAEELPPAPFPSAEEDTSGISEPSPEAPEPPEEAPAAPAEGPKFRLKPRGGEAASAQAIPPPPPPGFGVPSASDANSSDPSGLMFGSTAEMNIPTPSSPLYIPTVETEATESVRLDLTPPPPPAPPPRYEESPEYQAAQPRRGFQPKAGTIGLIAAAVFILGCGAFFVHRVVSQPSAARPVKTKSRIRSIPVAVDPVPTPVPPTPTPPPVVAEEKPKPSVTNSVTTSIAPGISATSAGAVEAVNASPAFRSWVAAARISGVFQGAEARALINNRMIRAGSIADDALAITFERIDAETKTIVFKDRTGAEVSRRY